jgi:hypothetical protein
MPISALDVAYRAMRKAYLEKEEAGRRLARLKKRFQELNQKVFGALPGDPGAAGEFAAKANEIEGDIKTADAAFVQAKRDYAAALAEFARLALEAGLDR